MKKAIIFQAVGAMVAGLVIAGFPNGAQLQLRDQAQSQCSVESKNQYYKDFLASHEGDSKDHAKALEAAKEYLACPGDSNDQEETLAKLNLAVGRILSLKNSSTEAIPYFIKAVSYNSTVKASQQTYVYLAEAYEQGPYEKLSAAYTSKFAGKDETDDSLLALENIYQIIDRMIDAYARAIALAGVEPSKLAPRNGLKILHSPTGPTDWIDDLTAFYKFRHKGSDAGLKELISTILSQPLPVEPAPITSLPSREK